MYKIENNLSPSIMSTVFPRCLIPYNLRSVHKFETSNVRTVHFGTETISSRGPKIWQMLPDQIKGAKGLTEFKNKIKRWEPFECDCRLCKTCIANLGSSSPCLKWVYLKRPMTPNDPQ